MRSHHDEKAVTPQKEVQGLKRQLERLIECPRRSVVGKDMSRGKQNSREHGTRHGRRSTTTAETKSHRVPPENFEMRHRTLWRVSTPSIEGHGWQRQTCNTCVRTHREGEGETNSRRRRAHHTNPALHARPPRQSFYSMKFCVGGLTFCRY